MQLIISNKVKIFLGIIVFLAGFYTLQGIFGRYNGREIAEDIKAIKNGTESESMSNDWLLPKHEDTMNDKGLYIKYGNLWPTQCRAILDYLNAEINIVLISDCEHYSRDNSITVIIANKQQ